jgi:acetyl-CoA carboxylase biotin carboxyl carrier protein
MLDIRKLKELVRLMVAHDLTELDLRDAEEQVTLRRHHHNQAYPAVVPQPLVAHAAPGAFPPPGGAGGGGSLAAPGGAAAIEPAGPVEGLHTIASPMVGTFYAAPNPDAPPYVVVGSRLRPDMVVCLVEAMKIFNEIKAECTGIVEKIVVSNGDPVDFGQALFLVRLE